MTLDTNILIAYLDGEQVVVDFVLQQKELGRAIFVSSISVAEVLSLSTLTDADIGRIRQFLGNFILVPFDTELAESAAFLRRRYKLSLPDAGLLATAITRQTPLLSRDQGVRKVTEVPFIDL